MKAYGLHLDSKTKDLPSVCVLQCMYVLTQRSSDSFVKLYLAELSWQLSHYILQCMFTFFAHNEERELHGKVLSTYKTFHVEVTAQHGGDKCNIILFINPIQHKHGPKRLFYTRLIAQSSL